MTDAFTTGVSAAVLVAFAAGLRRILDEILILAFALVVSGMLAVIGALEAAAVYVGTSMSYQTMTAPLWLMTQTAIVFVYFPGVGVLVAAALAVRRSNAMPRWLGWLAWAVAALVAVSSLAVFGGTGPFGPLGLLQVLLGFALVALTVLVFAVALLGRLSAPTQPAPAVS